MELGGNIELVGFNELDTSELIVLKKMIGNHARKYADYLKDGYGRLTVTMKPIHGKNSSKFEVQVKLLANNKPIVSEVTEINLFVCVADALKKVEAQVLKK